MISTHAAAHLLLQLSVILGVCLASRKFGACLGVPQVVGEVAAGIILGPSCLGAIAPRAQAWLFPMSDVDALGTGGAADAPGSMLLLQTLGQIGIVLFMFLVGAELDHSHFSKGGMRTASLVSVLGILAPFGAGVLLTRCLYLHEGFFGRSLSFWRAALFLGACMSVTAFPVLARIIKERSMMSTKAGTVSIAAASLDDLAAWGLLTLVLATNGESIGHALFSIAGVIAGAAAILLSGTRVARAISSIATVGDKGLTDALVGYTCVVLFAAWSTAALGAHAGIGAFLAGVVLPRGVLSEGASRSLSFVTTDIFVPAFFVYSGLQTRFDSLRSPGVVVVTIVVCLVAIVAKGFTCPPIVPRAGR